MIAEIISVGTEILLGEITDTNATYLANQLKDRGVSLYLKHVVGDNLGRIRQCITEALSRSDVVILGGGLGPTDDDLTREAIASALNETPYVDEHLLAHLKNLYTARGRAMPHSNIKQAWLILSAAALPNPIGTAPGWLVRVGEKTIVALPGPPSEMQRMWTEQVLPRLTLPETYFYHTTLHTQGIGESNIQDILGSLTQSANPSVATYARKTGVDVRVAGSGSNESEAKALAAPLQAEVEQRLKKFIYGKDQETLADGINNVLNGKTIAVFEGVSGGRVASQLASSTGLTAAVSTEQKALWVRYGLSPATIALHGEISQEAALELAAGIREKFDSDFGLATVGSSTTGLCYFAVSGEKNISGSINWVGPPEQIRSRAANAALMLLFKHLRGEA